jgi:hypothetical protein
VTTGRVPSKVKVGNVQILQVDYEMLNAEWFMQGYSFTSDFRVLPLQSFDMIVSMD